MSAVPRAIMVRTRAFYAVLFCLSFLVAFLGPFTEAGKLSLHDDRYTHILIIPVISALLMLRERKIIFLCSRYCPAWGIPMVVTGGILAFFAREQVELRTPEFRLAFLLLAAFVIGVGGFVLFLGLCALRRAAFPISLLLFAIPIPAPALELAVGGLQRGSADLAYALLKLVRVPVFQHGMELSLPGVTIEVAPACSGIRSTIALVLTTAVASHVFLQAPGSRMFITLFAIPLAIFKNALRIVVISLLGIYVDVGFLYGSLHRYGGLPFSLVAFGVLLPLFWALQRIERRRKESRPVTLSALS